MKTKNLFKKGDHVVLIKDNYDGKRGRAGWTGTIIDSATIGSYILFDNNNERWWATEDKIKQIGEFFVEDTRAYLAAVTGDST